MPSFLFQYSQGLFIGHKNAFYSRRQHVSHKSDEFAVGRAVAVVETIAEYCRLRFEFAVVETYAECVPDSSLDAARIAVEKFCKFGIKPFGYAFVQIGRISAREFDRRFQISATCEIVSETEFEKQLSQEIVFYSFDFCRNFFRTLFQRASQDKIRVIGSVVVGKNKRSLSRVGKQIAHSIVFEKVHIRFFVKDNSVEYGFVAVKVFVILKLSTYTVFAMLNNESENPLAKRIVRLDNGNALGGIHKRHPLKIEF